MRANENQPAGGSKLSKERRRKPRFECSGLVDLTEVCADGQHRFWGTGLFDNVSESGACIQVDRTVPVGVEMILRNRAGTLEVRAVVQNIRRHAVGFFIGVEFTSGLTCWPDPSKTAILSADLAIDKQSVPAHVFNRPAPRAQVSRKDSPAPKAPARVQRAETVRTLASFTTLMQRLHAFSNKVWDAFGPADEDGNEKRHRDALTDTFSSWALENDPLGLFEDAPAKAVVLNADFTIAYANTKFIHLVGSKSLLADRRFEQFIVEEDLDRVMQSARSAITEPGAVRSVSFQLQAQAGELLEVNSSWRYSLINQRMFVELMNVTQERREERELIALLCDAADGSHGEPVGIAGWTWDVHSQTVECSRDYVRLYRLDPRTVTLDRAAWMNMIEPEDRPRIHQAIREALEGSGVIRIEFRARRPDDSVAWMASRGHVVFNERGEAVQIVGKTVDITNIRQRGRSSENMAAVVHAGGGCLSVE